MRILVITVFLALLAQTAGADTPLAMRRCNGPYNCITINTGPCGSIMTNDRNGISVGVAALSNPNFPRVEGACGFYDPPFYTPVAPPRPASDKYFPPAPEFIDRQ